MSTIQPIISPLYRGVGRFQFVPTLHRLRFSIRCRKCALCGNRCLMVDTFLGMFLFNCRSMSTIRQELNSPR